MTQCNRYVIRYKQICVRPGSPTNVVTVSRITKMCVSDLRSRSSHLNTNVGRVGKSFRSFLGNDGRTRSVLSQEQKTRETMGDIRVHCVPFTEYLWVIPDL